MDYETFMQTCGDKIRNGELIYQAMGLFIAKRFKVEIPRWGDVDGGVWAILNHYIENVDEDFQTWIDKEDAPMIRPVSQLRKIFPEFKYIKEDWKLIETANKIYGLDMELDHEEEYFFSLSFDFNSFTPINVDGIHELKEEIKVLQKYGYPTDELEAKIAESGLDPEIVEVL
jgi:hypothetical protein